ncbi:MAG: hypothetical protein E6F93_09430 [Actinobacteria bacterium]|nr:MAG: hypothetical protein E6F93_09430 [Actinomycetota bacterium]
MKLRAGIVAAVAVAGVSLAAVLVPRQGHGAPLRAGAEAGEEHEATRVVRGALCGVERWPVKTLSDPGARQIDFTVRPATVRYLGSLQANPGGQDSRGPLETRVFGVQARLVSVKRESDSDYHLVLAQGGATMIAEMPLTGCTSGAQHRYAMALARTELEHAVGGPVGGSWIHPGVPVRIVGVLFFDFPHGQSGHARNYAELHPVTGFRVLNGSR